VQRFYKIIVVPFLLVVAFAKAQYQPAFSGDGVTNTVKQTGLPTGIQNSSKKVFENRLKPGLALVQAPFTRSYLRPDFYTAHLAFFCRSEWQLEKSFNIPLRFRLGSLQYTDALEGKRGSNMKVQ